MDMTAWVKEGTEESVGVITDFVYVLAPMLLFLFVGTVRDRR